MSHHSKSFRHQTPEQQKVAQSYAARIVIGKLVLVLAGCAFVAVIFLPGAVDRVVTIGALALGGGCFLSIFFGDFPAFARCPACGKRMKVKTHDDARPYKRYRYLACSQCNQTVELSADKTFGAAP